MLRKVSPADDLALFVVNSTSTRIVASTTRTCMVFFLFLALCFSAAGCNVDRGQQPFASRSEQGPVDFVVRVNDERFVVRLVTSEQIAIARARIAGTLPQGIVSGELADTDGGFNRVPGAGEKWSWHLRPESITFPQLTAEVCDGMPSHVESDKQYWLKQVKRFCPWKAKFERELRSTDWIHRQDFTQNVGWDVDQDGVRVRWCEDKEWTNKTGCAANGALRLNDDHDEVVVFADFGDRDCSTATITLHYYHLQVPPAPPDLAGSRLQYRVIADPDPQCADLPRVYKNVRLLNHTAPVELKPKCFKEEASVDIKPGDRVVCWRFVKRDYPTPLIIDDITLTLTGRRAVPQ